MFHSCFQFDDVAAWPVLAVHSYKATAGDLLNIYSDFDSQVHIVCYSPIHRSLSNICFDVIFPPCLDGVCVVVSLCSVRKGNGNG